MAEAQTWRVSFLPADSMVLKSKAQAVAQLDAVCDQYEAAYRQGALGDDTAGDLAPWLDRVEPELRSWLKDELCQLRDELESSRSGQSTRAPAAEVPSDVDPQSWKAVVRCETFQPLSQQAKVALARGIQPQDIPRGQWLMRRGGRTGGLYLIRDGEVEVVVGEGASRHRIDLVGVGSVLGEMSLLTGHPCSADVIATTPARALVLSADAYDSLREQHPELEIALSQLVSDRLGHRSHDALCGKSLGGFRLERCISSGAMGVVYIAVDESSGTRRALKMLRHRFIYSPRVVSRFDQEADLLRQLEHPNIVSLRGHFVEYRTRFIVLDLYDGADLRKVLRRCGSLSESTARGVLGQIAAGLRHAHRQGVLHLDLKPANVLVNKAGHIAITDFGLSRLMESDGVDREVVGTPQYMPPEQFTMTNIGEHCDWYSLGCVACELLTGRRLFAANGSSGVADDKLRCPSSDWPPVAASEHFLLHLKTALQPVVDHRDLDLDEIASWARPVPELADYLDETYRPG